MSTSERARLATDDRGAMMVLGIFMCTCLVGALWYLAGIGDTILLRERAQEAADAIAFSDAALHARGMNLIVLVNLVMACVLGVRVALKIAQLVLTIAASVFGALGFLAPPFWALVGPCLAGVQVLEKAITATREPVNTSLQSLSLTQDAIARATPGAARTGALLMVGGAYAPAVTRAGVTHFGSDASLPVASGSQDKLCKEAARTVGYYTGYVFEKAGLGNVRGEPARWLGDKLAWVASTSPRHFCELGSVKGDVDVTGLFDQPARERCANAPDADRQASRASQTAWEDKCREYGVTCEGTDARGEPTQSSAQRGSTTPERQRELDRLRLLRDQDARAVKETRERFGDKVEDGERAECEKHAKSDMQRRRREQDELSKKQQAPGTRGDGSGVTPKKVDDGFRNGSPKAQVGGGALPDAARLARSAGLVRVGARRDPRGGHAPEGAELPSWAQAEFFFDCVGTWAQCNDDEEAMWHLKWRARLRRWNEPEPLRRALLEMGLVQGAGVDLAGFSDRARATQGRFTPSPALRAELERALRRTREKGMH